MNWFEFFKIVFTVFFCLAALLLLAGAAVGVVREAKAELAAERAALEAEEEE